MGGAIFFNAQAATLTNCTIVGGNANSGGGVFVNRTGMTIANTIVAGNSSLDGNDDLGRSNNATDGGHNLIGVDIAGAFINGDNGDIIGTSLTPVDAIIGMLGNNGGHTKTIRLEAGSPAIDAGDINIAPPTDQRGHLRAGTPDIGAFEFGSDRSPQFDSDPLTLPIISRTPLNYLVRASDIDGDPVTITAPTVPAWITLHDNGDGTALLSGTPTDDDGGINDVTLHVSDGTLSADQTSSFVVAAPRFQLDGGVLTIAGGIDADNIHIWIRGTDQVRAVYNGLIKNFSLSAFNQVEVYGFDGDDTLTVNMRTTPTYVLGGAGDDMIQGYDEPDNLVGGGGKDYIDAGSNDDRLDGGNGKDTLLGGDGDDRLYGGDDDDDLVGGAGLDQIDAGAGNNLIYAKDSAVDRIWPGVNDLIDKDDIDLLFVLT
jgi:Ca2+-binding RTX toxin-like protein